MHGLAIGQESRQQLYTMLTRGRAANYLTFVVGDGDPHTVTTRNCRTRTPTEMLQQILSRDDSPTSASTLLRGLSDPAARLFDAVQRYTDGLQVAAEQLVGPQIVERPIAEPTRSSPNSPANRPGRRCGHICSLAAETGEHPLLHLHTAAVGRELHIPPVTWPPCSTGASRARSYDPGPLPGFPAPTVLHDHPVWGQYLATRSELVIGLATQVRRHATQEGTQPCGRRLAATRPRPSLVSRRLACRRRYGPPRPTTHRSRAVADCGRPVATTPRPTYPPPRRRPGESRPAKGPGCPENQQELQPRRPASPRAVRGPPNVATAEASLIEGPRSRTVGRVLQVAGR